MLQGEPCCNSPNVSTIGIDFYEWKMFDIEILIIDCAGEKKYMLTHQLFLSTGKVCISIRYCSSVEHIG